MPQTAAAFAPAIGQIGGGLLSRALGGGDRPDFQFPDVIAGGLQIGDTASGQIFVRERLDTPEGRRRRAALEGSAAQFRQLGSEIGGLRQRLGPGFSNVLESRLQAVETGRQRAIGTISENLSRRRVLGSSFGQAAIAQAEREFAEAEATARAQTFLESIDVEQQLIFAENSALIESFNTELNELNLQLQAGSSVLGGAIQAQSQNNLLQQQLAAQAAGGFGAFGAQVGNIFGDILRGIGGNEGEIRTDAAGRILGRA